MLFGLALITAPKSGNKVELIGPKPFDFAAGICLGYAVQDFLVQVLANTIHPNQYRKAIYLVYVIGFFSYNLVGYSCFAIVNREPTTEDPAMPVRKVFSWRSYEYCHSSKSSQPAYPVPRLLRSTSRERAGKCA